MPACDPDVIAAARPSETVRLEGAAATRPATWRTDGDAPTHTASPTSSPLATRMEVSDWDRPSSHRMDPANFSWDARETFAPETDVVSSGTIIGAPRFPTPTTLRTAMGRIIFQLGTNNWQRCGEFAPGSGILHEAHHNSLFELPDTKSYSVYPSKTQRFEARPSPRASRPRVPAHRPHHISAATLLLRLRRLRRRRSTSVSSLSSTTSRSASRSHPYRRTDGTGCRRASSTRTGRG